MYTLHIRISIYVMVELKKNGYINYITFEREIIYEIKRKVGEYRE